MNKNSFNALLTAILLSGRGTDLSEEEVVEAIETSKKILTQTKTDEELN